jgi:hypothetical protein
MRIYIAVMAAILLAFAASIWAVDGIAVTVRAGGLLWSGACFDGDIYRIDIKSSKNIKETKLVSKPASEPHICPDGTRIAFLQDSCICIIIHSDILNCA